MIDTTYDLRDNISALTLAICSEGFLLPEQAFSILEKTKFVISVEDTEDMIAMREEGITYGKIGEIYNTSDSNIYHRLKRHKKTY